MTDFAERIREAFAGDGAAELGGAVADVLAAALRAAHPLAGVDGEAMLAEMRQDVDEIVARRQESAAAHADQRRAGLAAYERGRRELPGVAGSADLGVYASAILGHGERPVWIC